jgi:hypothetical protein
MQGLIMMNMIKIMHRILLYGKLGLNKTEKTIGKKNLKSIERKLFLNEDQGGILNVVHVI